MKKIKINLLSEEVHDTYNQLEIESILKFQNDKLLNHKHSGKQPKIKNLLPFYAVLEVRLPGVIYYGRVHCNFKLVVEKMKYILVVENFKLDSFFDKFQAFTTVKHLLSWNGVEYLNETISQTPFVFAKAINKQLISFEMIAGQLVCQQNSLFNNVDFSLFAESEEMIKLVEVGSITDIRDNYQPYKEHQLGDQEWQILETYYPGIIKDYEHFGYVKYDGSHTRDYSKNESPVFSRQNYLFK